jgi:hypothetical protein
MSYLWIFVSSFSRIRAYVNPASFKLIINSFYNRSNLLVKTASQRQSNVGTIWAMNYSCFNCKHRFSYNEIPHIPTFACLSITFMFLCTMHYFSTTKHAKTYTAFPCLHPVLVSVNVRMMPRHIVRNFQVVPWIANARIRSWVKSHCTYKLIVLHLCVGGSFGAWNW